MRASESVYVKENEGERERLSLQLKWLGFAMFENNFIAEKNWPMTWPRLDEVWMANAVPQLKQKWLSSMLGRCHSPLTYKRSQVQIPL